MHNNEKKTTTTGTGTGKRTERRSERRVWRDMISQKNMFILKFNEKDEKIS